MLTHSQLSRAMRRGLILGLAFVALSIHTPASAQTYAGQMGVEAGCDGVGPFINAAKGLRPFTIINSSPLTNTPVDANGYPTTDGQTVIFDLRPIPAWAPPLDDPAQFQPNMSGAYLMSFNGQATIGVTDVCPATISNQVYNSSTNTTTATITMPAGGYSTAPALMYLTFTNTIRTFGGATNTGITNLVINYPGYALNTTQLFTNQYLAAPAPFDKIRYMGWKDTNFDAGYYGDPGHHLLNWSDRGLPTDITQQSNTTLHADSHGMAWEYIILMANALNKDVWICVPVSASGYSTTDTTSYIYNLALLFKNGDAFTGGHGLNPGLHIYIEHSNEVWNTIYSQYTWNKLEAVDSVAGTGSLGTTHVNNDGSTDQEVWAQRRHAERLYEIANIFAAVFGTGSLNTTIRPVYASFVIGAQQYFTNVLNWMNTTYGAPHNYFYAMGGTSYFAEPNGPQAGESVATIIANMQAGSDNNLVYTKQLRTVATNFGLKLFTYEGGPDNGGGNTTNIGNVILANRDAGMTGLLEHDVRTNYFVQGGGDLYNYLALSSQYDRYGCWGINEDITNLNTTKWQAIYNLTGFTQGGAPSAPTGLTATGGNTQAVLNWNASSGATSYNVYRSTTAGGEGTTAIASGITPATYINTGLTNGTTYYYKVSATNASGTSAQSSEASATPSAPPAAPTGLTATAENSQVALSWTASSGATSYNVKRSTVNGSGYAQVTNIATTSYTNTGLTNGTTYYFVVTAVNGAGESGNSNQASATSQPTIPAPPTGLTATAGDTQVSLSWTASSGATSYNALRSTVNGSGYASVATGIATTAYTNTGLTDGTTYYFVVTATNTAGTSGNSNQASATPVVNTGTVMASEPFGEATGALNGANGGAGWSGAWVEQNGNNTVPGYNVASTTALTFSNLSTSGNYGVGGYSYESAGRGLDLTAGGAFGANGYLSGGLIGVSGKTLWISALIRKDTATEDPNYLQTNASGTVWTLSGPLIGMGYFGASSDNGGNRYWSLEVGSTVYQSTTPITVGTTALLVARIDFGATNTVALYVNPSSLGGSAPAANVTQTTATNLAFRSLAYFGGNGAGCSSIDELRFGTSYSSVTPTSGGSAPPAPTGLTATPGNAQVALSWTASSGATSYNVLRSTVNGSGYASVATGIATTSYTNTGLTNGTTYYFVVTATNSIGTSGNSNQASATPNVVPAAPAGLTATPGNTQVALSWTASSGATSYNVKRSTVNGSGYATITSPSGTSYTDTGLTNGTTYYYVVSAVNSAGESANSAQASATPQPGAPPAPTGLTATPGNAQVALSWTASSGATSYNVLRSTVNGSGYAPVVTGIAVTNYTNTGLTNGTTYYFVVTATNGGGTSGNSNQSSATPTAGPPPAPTGLTATPGNTQVALSWTASSGATSYNVLRSTVNGSGYASVATGIAVTNYTNTGLTNGITYYFVVTATNASGTSGNSNQASATPAAGGGGTLFASEPFGEAAGALNGANGNASGWSGAWVEQNGNTTVPGYNVASGTLSYSTLTVTGNHGVGGYSYESAGRGLDLTAGGPFGTNGYLTSGLIGASGKTLWMSALIRKDANFDDENSLRLTSSGTVWQLATPLAGIGYFGASSNNGGTRYWSLNVNGTVIRTTVPVVVGTTALLVVRMDFGATNTETLYVNPASLGGSAPGTSSASGTTTTSIAFRSLAYYGANGAGGSSIDEIRFGDTYAAVTQ